MYPVGLIKDEDNMSINYRKIVEKNIGRKLKSFEIVHHIDCDQNNNNIENLEIIKGQSNHIKCKHLKEEDWVKKLSVYLEKDIDYRAESLNNKLNLFFTSRQKQIIFRKLNNQVLSKTEKEYYSRVIKKKLSALANPFLHEVACIIMC